MVFGWLAVFLLTGCGDSEKVLSLAATTQAANPTATLPAPTVLPTATPVKVTQAPVTTLKPALTLAPTVTPRIVASATPTATVKVSTRTAYYDIQGTTAEQLGTQLYQQGPLDVGGKRFAGKTDGSLGWSYSYSKPGGKCALVTANIELEVVFSLPRWDIPPNTPPELVDKWNKFSAALQTHENGHRDIFTTKSYEFAENVKALPVFATCDELNRAITLAGQRMVDESQRQNIEYDDRTEHGKTQGAVFP